MSRPETDWINLAAKKKIPNCPPDWQYYRWEHLEGGTIVEGSIGVPQPKGGHQWPKPRKDYHRVIITSDDVKAEKLAFEAATGECWQCEGTGKKVVGWNVDEGTKYRPCDRCAETGKAPEVRHE